MTPLYLASWRGHLSIVHYYVENGYTFDNQSSAEELKNLQENYDFFTENDVLNATVNGDLESLKKSLQGREDPNPLIFGGQKGAWYRVLEFAAYFGHVNILKWFKDEMAYPEMNTGINTKWSPLNLATFNGKLNVVKYYINSLNFDATSKGLNVNMYK